jgi:site-specific DNA-methyltransferase (adenine-specific)
VTATLHTGDCIEVMRALASASFDAIVTDPPYELDFMGKAWDRTGIAFRPETWAEALRLAKPGSWLLAFGGARTHHRVACAIEDAGWELRDTIMWIYGSGFPKSKNGPWGGSALKPAHEPIVVAQKPRDGTYANNFAEHGTGGLNIEACRVPTAETLRTGNGAIPCRHDETIPRGRTGEGSAGRRYKDVGSTDFAATPGPRGGDIAGRWPANIIHDGSDEVVAAFPNAPGQQGDLRGQSRKRVSKGVYGDMAAAPDAPDAPARKDIGSAARFFYCAKASTKDREAGLDGFEKAAGGFVSNNSGQHITRRDGYEPPKRANTHPTVKPTELMRYLCQLVTPPGGTILDLFVGSGSTGRGAALGGFDFEGIDNDPHHIAIARARIAHAARLYDSRRQQRIDLRDIA